LAYAGDEAILSLLQASLEGDAGQMAAALPRGTARFQYHLQFLDKWRVALSQGAPLAKKVLLLMDMALIAVNIYQVWKIPVVAGRGAPSPPPPPPRISGVLPGGVAVSSWANVANLAK